MRPQKFFLPIAVTEMLLLSGCLETSREGLSANARTKYARMALVASVSENAVSTYWDAAFSEPKPTEGRLEWNASRATINFVRDQVTPTGTKLTVVTSHTSSSMQANDAVLALQQTPLNTLGQNYFPGRDVLALGGGLIGISAAASSEPKKDQLFKPRFVLWVRNPAANKAMIGEIACTVGLTASLLDASSGEALQESVQVSRRMVIPDALSAPDWARMPKSEKKRVLSYCNLALRSAVSQALVRLNVAK